MEFKVAAAFVVIACIAVVWLPFTPISKYTIPFLPFSLSSSTTTGLWSFSLLEKLPTSISLFLGNIFSNSDDTVTKNPDSRRVDDIGGNNHDAKGGVLLSKKELLNYKNKYLAIVGEVFNVATDKGVRHYGPEGGYNFFTGIDGTRAFSTGKFTEEGLIDDVSGLDAQEIASIEEWRNVYHTEYEYVGKVIGNFYDSNGEETEAKIKFRQLLVEAAKLKLKKAEFNKLYPPCNSEFKKGKSRVWCSSMSGGIKRSWVGVPRKLYDTKSEGYRCACVRTTGPKSSDMQSTNHDNRGDLDNPKLALYGDCNPSSESCPI